ncbi:hypothetical protein SE916_23400, partial [Pseudomonas sp. 5FOS]|uniref:hypothetical protein n=1 Tax=unclassified Pseudomonas TaxID=196821 RepID=UPI0030EAD888
NVALNRSAGWVPGVSFSFIAVDGAHIKIGLQGCQTNFSKYSKKFSQITITYCPALTKTEQWAMWERVYPRMRRYTHHRIRG